MHLGRFACSAALGLVSLGASCPRVDEDAAEAPVVVVAPAPATLAPAAAPPPARVIAQIQPAAEPAPVGEAVAPEAESGGADPAELTELPPELVDDGSDALPEDPDPAPTPEVEELASVAHQTWVYAEPRWSSRKLGYLRSGAVVQRRDKPAGRSSCAGGWYAIEPHGYVCVGKTATLDVFDPIVEASARRPRLDGLPYTYVMSRYPTPPLYARLPTRAEQSDSEPGLAKLLREAAAREGQADFVAPPAPEATPNALLYGQALPALAGVRRDPDALVIGKAKQRSGFALLSTFDHEGRQFGLTTELALIPMDRTRVVQESSFVGLRLDDEVTLPVAFVMRRHAMGYAATEGAGLGAATPLTYRQAIPITGETRRVGGGAYYVARDGSLVRQDQVVVVEKYKKAPAWTNRKWIDVSILRQSIVAYEGTRPVYVSLVSTGADGLGDPKETHSTIQGAFLIHTKHVSATMDADADEGDEFDLRDVPFVQYFTEGYALHAAYWHDDFGRPRSHGCINLAPKDAAWLFGWTDPQVPEGWHAALSLKKGTLVYIHP